MVNLLLFSQDTPEIPEIYAKRLDKAYIMIMDDYKNKEG
jgi:hypothetical protein